MIGESNKVTRNLLITIQLSLALVTHGISDVGSTRPASGPPQGLLYPALLPNPTFQSRDQSQAVPCFESILDDSETALKIDSSHCSQSRLPF